jgi:hypothetical protein
LTSVPGSTVASWTMARTAYSALADIRMMRIVPPAWLRTSHQSISPVASLLPSGWSTIDT